jgi:formylglycine-generating enzyme required for sulfatase activity
VSLAGKRDYEQRVSIAAGQVAVFEVALIDAERPSPPAPIETPHPRVSAPRAGPARENAKDGLKYVWVDPGTFTMGCSAGDNECLESEKPAHQVTISRGFWIGQTPVTVGAYLRFTGSNGRKMPPAPNFNRGWADENMPIVNVTWTEAQAYCGWIGGRLPTEAEWEYAARGGSSDSRYGNLDEIAWYNNNSGRQTHAVGQKRANGSGLQDVLGNVWEWCNDWYDDHYYPSSPAQDPPGPGAGQFRVLRGGSWSSYFRLVRLSYRFRVYPNVRITDLGFRCTGEAGNP